MSQQPGSEVGRQGKVAKSTTPRTARKEEVLPWVGFEPKALCSLGECSTMYFYYYAVPKVQKPPVEIMAQLHAINLPCFLERSAS